MLLAFALPAAASAADVVLEESFESGLNGWTTPAEVNADNLWHVETNPQTLFVSRTINSNLVTLPDSGQLPSAYHGASVAWFGDRGSGTFCSSHGAVAQSPKNGCRTQLDQTGSLVSPAFDLASGNPTSAQVEFWSWWEIEGVHAHQFDVMTVEYSVDGSRWQEAGKLNPSNNPAAAHDRPYTANGVSKPATWHRYVADISGAVGHPAVRLRFRFDSRDENYQGFRGWLVDSVKVTTPYAEPAPRIDALVPECTRPGQARIVTVEGEHFVLGSTVQLDGRTIVSATPASTRMEFTAPSTLTPGAHEVRVVVGGAHAAASNVALLQVRADCAAKRVTATQVRCDRGPNPWDPSKCTATIGDADVPPRITPVGRVRMSSADGAFRATYECALTPTPLSPGVASCVVHNVPAGRDGFASIRADYLGSDQHLPSNATTGFILAAGSGPPADPRAMCAGNPRAGAAVQNDYYTFNQPGLDFGDLGYCFTMLALGGGEAVSWVVEGTTYVAIPAAGVAGAVVTPGPPNLKLAAGGTAAAGTYYVTMGVREVNRHVYTTIKTAQQDPPDPRFKRLARPRRKPRVVRLLPGGGVTRTQARSLTALNAQLARTSEFAKALTATLDRAGGAALASDTAWEARQMRHALKLAPRLAAQLDRSARLMVKARKSAKRLPGVNRPYNLKVAKRVARQVVKRGYTRSQRRMLKAFGATKADLRALRASQRRTLRIKSVKQLPIRKPIQLYGKRSVEGMRMTARAFRYWAALPEVRDLANPGR